MASHEEKPEVADKPISSMDDTNQCKGLTTEINTGDEAVESVSVKPTIEDNVMTSVGVEATMEDEEAMESVEPAIEDEAMKIESEDTTMEDEAVKSVKVEPTKDEAIKSVSIEPTVEGEAMKIGSEDTTVKDEVLKSASADVTTKDEVMKSDDVKVKVKEAVSDTVGTESETETGNAVVQIVNLSEGQEIQEDVGDAIPPGRALIYRKADRGYDSDSSASVSTDNSSIQLSSDSEGEEQEVNKATPTEQKKKKNKGKNKDVFEIDMRTKGELGFEELPTIDDLKIDVDPKVVLMEVGAVQTILGPIVIVQANKSVPALDQDTILFSKDRSPIGQVFETFGPVPAPLYIIRFNSAADIEKHGVFVGQQVFYAPSMKEYTRFVFVEQLKQMQGSDASWEHNNEPPEKHLDYSDDEEERKARHSKKANDNNAEGEEDGETATGEKKRRKARAKRQNDSRDNSSGQHGRPQHGHYGAAWPPAEPGSTKWSQPPPPGIPQWPPAPPPGGVGYRQGPPPAPSGHHMMGPRHPAGPQTRPWRTVSPGNFHGPPGNFSSGPPPGSYNEGPPSHMNGGPPSSGPGNFNSGPGSYGNGPPGGFGGGGRQSPENRWGFGNGWVGHNPSFDGGRGGQGGPPPPQHGGPWGPTDNSTRGMMDMRYVQSIDGPPQQHGPPPHGPPQQHGPDMSHGPRAHMHPQQPQWQQPPRNSFFRPPSMQFGGAPSFTQGPPGWNG